MEKENIETSFSYTYSAKEQEEIKRIQKKYQTREVNDIDKLRMLDAKVTEKATTVSLILGIVGALILGTGMSLIMTDFGNILGLQGITNIVIGIAVGLIGLVLVTLAYPMYQKTLKKEREKIAPEILRMTEELIKQ